MTRQDVIDAILKWPGLYEDENGRRFSGMPVSQVPSQLVDCGWRNCYHLGTIDFEMMGLKITRARYIGGARPKKFCNVVEAS